MRGGGGGCRGSCSWTHWVQACGLLSVGAGCACRRRGRRISRWGIARGSGSGRGSSCCCICRRRCAACNGCLPRRRISHRRRLQPAAVGCSGEAHGAAQRTHWWVSTSTFIPSVTIRFPQIKGTVQEPMRGPRQRRGHELFSTERLHHCSIQVSGCRTSSWRRWQGSGLGECALAWCMCATSSSKRLYRIFGGAGSGGSGALWAPVRGGCGGVCNAHFRRKLANMGSLGVPGGGCLRGCMGLGDTCSNVLVGASTLGFRTAFLKCRCMRGLASGSPGCSGG